MNESNIFGISVRAIIAVILVLTCVVLAFSKIPIDETVKYLVVSVVSFYFGNKQNGGTNTPNSTSTITSSNITTSPEIKQNV